MSKYFLGVDGGNSKTDYLLCTIDGAFVDVFRTDTCSHERFDNGYDGMEKAMRAQLAVLFERNSINVEDIASTGFGLAGADLPVQYTELRKKVESMGFKQYGLANDGILGIKGATDSGVGLCAVNGTGTVILGIDEKGGILQVGGVGEMSNDFAGGGYICRQIIVRLYAFHYRCGADSAMFAPIMDLLGVKQEDLLEVTGDGTLVRKHMAEIIQIGAKAAQAGDPLAMEIFDNIGKNIGQGAAGCIKHLSFDDETIDIVLVGSIWHKIPYGGMTKVFVETAQALSGKKIRPVKLEAPSAVGGVLWAKEIADGALVPAAYRKNLLEAITLEKYEAKTGDSK